MRRVVLAGGGVVVVGIVVVGTLGLGGSRDEPAPVADLADTTVKVEKGTLINAASADGELNYGAETPIGMTAEGVVTWLPAEGTVVDRGQPLLRINDRPVVLLFGDMPSYRDLAEPAPPAEGQPAPPPLTGRDVEQLKANLAALGHTGLKADKVFTPQTTAAVKKWQKRLGLPETGTVAMTDVCYAPGPVRIARSLVRWLSSVHKHSHRITRARPWCVGVVVVLARRDGVGHGAVNQLSLDLLGGPRL